MDTREAVTRELLAGATPYQLTKRYPKKSVYRIYNELMASDQLSEPGVITVGGGGEMDKTPLFDPIPPAPPVTQPTAQVETKEAAPESIDMGETSLPVDAVNRVRGVLGISLRPKVLNCPMPELLYPSMVIAVTELGFPVMRPDDFIDTVLYQWLEACDYIPYAYLKVSEVERLAKKYSTVDDGGDGDKQPPPIAKGEDVKKVAVEKVEEALAEVTEEVTDEAITEEETDEIDEVDDGIVNNIANNEEDIKSETQKPTVGDMFKCLHIDNISKEAGNDS
jgi:hypothetical protein